MSLQQITIRGPPSASYRRQPLLTSQKSTPSMRFAEVAGGTTAECAAVACCCPCGLASLLVFAVYKIPAGLCRRALRMRRQRRLLRLQKRGQVPPPSRRIRCHCGCDDYELGFHGLHMQSLAAAAASAFDKPAKLDEAEKAIQDLEKEMLDLFYGTGFWRSLSQKEQNNNTWPHGF